MDILEWLANNAETPIIVMLVVVLYFRLQTRHWKTQDDCTARERKLLDRLTASEKEVARLSNGDSTGQEAAD